MYHQKLPELARVKMWTEKRKTNLKSRWNEEKERQCLEWWENYFMQVKQSNFLLGKSNGNGSREKLFKADLEWIINASNMAKILEGKYNNPEKLEDWRDRLPLL